MFLSHANPLVCSRPNRCINFWLRYRKKTRWDCFSIVEIIPRGGIYNENPFRFLFSTRFYLVLGNNRRVRWFTSSWAQKIIFGVHFHPFSWPDYTGIMLFCCFFFFLLSFEKFTIFSWRWRIGLRLEWRRDKSVAKRIGWRRMDIY